MLENDYNISPFFDDFSEDKNFHRIMFRPSIPVQARELTQLQTILQNQIERFGDNIFSDGTVIKGCNFSFDDEYYYVKLPDLRVDGQTTNPDNYLGYRVVSSTSNLQAIVVNSAQGLETQNPDLHTIFIKYQNSGTSGEKQFSPDEELYFYSNTNPANTTSRVSEYTVKVAPAQINSVNTNPIGKGYAFTVSEGVVFQKGFFIRVANNLTTVISKYTNTPNNLVVGFNTAESIVTEYEDASLYDNASGYTNENAPGAYRLKLTPGLLVANADALPSNTFFSLVEWQNGKPIKLKQQTEYSQLGREMARRTYEESGNYVVNPFTISNEAISGNTTHFNVVTSSGLAFVEGYRVENLNNRGIAFRKGTDTETVSGQILNANYGNYVYVNEAVGTFPFNTGVTVSLRSAASGGITADTYSLTAPGSEIGTAKLISYTYDSGTPGTPAGQYRAYLTDIRMNSGYTFSSVKSIYYDGPTYDGLADCVLESGKAVLKDANLSALIIPTGKFAVSAVSNINFTYKTSTWASSYKIDATTGAMSTITLTAGYQFPYGTGTMSSVSERKVVVVPTNAANVATPSKSGTIQANGNIVQGTGTKFLTEYDVNDYINMNTQVKRIVSVANDTYLTLSSNLASNVAAGNAHAKHYPSGVPIPIQERNTYINLPNTSSMTLQLVSKTGAAETLSSNLNIILYYDVQKNTSSPITKQVLKNQVVKIDTTYFLGAAGTIACNTTSTTVTGNGTSFASSVLPGYKLYDIANTLIGTVQSVTNATSLTLSANATLVYSNAQIKMTSNGSVGPAGPWSLGVPDAYNLKNVYRTTGNTYSNSSTNDVTSLFKLNTNQKDGIYDLSYIELNQGAYGQISNGDKLLVVFDTFKASTGSGVGFFTKDSYPIDPNESTANTSAIRTIDIPRYTASNGSVLDLRDSFDFRPVVSNTAVYTGVIASASINPANTSSLPSGELYIASPEQSFTYSVSYNLGRIDKLIINSFGNFQAVQGTPSLNPAYPADISSAMTLATVYVPPYPSLTLAQNLSVNRPEYTIKTSTYQNVRYTMKDISKLENRLSSVEYYTSLSLLERKTNNLVIKSDVNGLDVFKNGIFVDDFSDKTPADMSSSEFRIGYDSAATTLIPLFQQSALELQYSSGGQKTNEILTLPYTEEAYIVQDKATRVRVCTDQVWNFHGTGTAYPGYDSLPDTRVPGVSTSPSISDTPFPGITPAKAPQYLQGRLNISFCKDIYASAPYLSSPVVTAADYPSVNPAYDYNALSEYNYGTFIEYTGYNTPTAAFLSSFKNISQWPFAYFDGPYNKLYDALNRRFNVSAYTYSGNRQKSGAFTSVLGQVGIYWSGLLQVPETGTWTFYGTFDDGMVLYIDGNLVFGNWADGTARTASGAITLTAGQMYNFQMFYYNAGSAASACCVLECQGPTVARQNVPYSYFYVPVGYESKSTVDISPAPAATTRQLINVELPLAAPGTPGGYPLTDEAVSAWNAFQANIAEYGSMLTLQDLAHIYGYNITNWDQVTWAPKTTT